MRCIFTFVEILYPPAEAVSSNLRSFLSLAEDWQDAGGDDVTLTSQFCEPSSINNFPETSFRDLFKLVASSNDLQV